MITETLNHNLSLNLFKYSSETKETAQSSEDFISSLSTVAKIAIPTIAGIAILALSSVAIMNPTMPSGDVKPPSWLQSAFDSFMTAMTKQTCI